MSSANVEVTFSPPVASHSSSSAFVQDLMSKLPATSRLIVPSRPTNHFCDLPTTTPSGCKAGLSEAETGSDPSMRQPAPSYTVQVSVSTRSKFPPRISSIFRFE